MMIIGPVSNGRIVTGLPVWANKQQIRFGISAAFGFLKLCCEHQTAPLRLSRLNSRMEWPCRLDGARTDHPGALVSGLTSALISGCIA
jgi:hypothetical protein